jgi:hypothetical protein
MSRPLSTNPLTKSAPIATVRREQVTNDPLGDILSQANNRSGTGSPLPESETNAYASPQPSSQAAFFPSRPASTGDVTDMLADQLLADCRCALFFFSLLNRLNLDFIE